jgi:hypothetical protein
MDKAFRKGVPVLASTFETPLLEPTAAKVSMEMIKLQFGKRSC